jgi:hypothetical protein
MVICYLINDKSPIINGKFFLFGVEHYAQLFMTPYINASGSIPNPVLTPTARYQRFARLFGAGQSHAWKAWLIIENR